jgi:hypothetical protein
LDCIVIGGGRNDEVRGWENKMKMTPLVLVTSLAFSITGGAADSDFASSTNKNVQSLVGMIFRPAAPGVATEIPRFKSVGGGMIGDLRDKERKGFALGFDEGIYDEIFPVLLIQRIRADRSVEIADVQPLPSHLIEWQYSTGKFKYNQSRFRLSSDCRFGDSASNNNEVIFGLVKHEVGKATCGHYSGRVARAWSINQNGQISKVPTQGVRCYFLTMGDC